MQYWWVNQNQTYKHEVNGNYLWSPKTKSDGTRNPFYDTMIRVEEGDLVFSFCDTYIKAIGVAQSSAESAPKPIEFSTAGLNWSTEGWLVPVTFSELDNIIRPKDHIAQLQPTLPRKYSPLQNNGNGNQTVYLTEVPEPMAAVLIQLIGTEAENITSLASINVQNIKDQRAEEELRQRDDLPTTTKEQLIQARRGQGLFRLRVRSVEPNCRITKLSVPEHLRASHIKPWRSSTDIEKLDGMNGLMLAPHMDHLFDKGYISFSDAGQLMLSSLLSEEVRTAMNVPMELDVGTFTPQQLPYLAYHREHVFKG